MKDIEVCRTCSMHRRFTRSYKILVGVPERSIQLMGYRWEDNTKVELK